MAHGRGREVQPDKWPLSLPWSRRLVSPYLSYVHETLSGHRKFTGVLVRSLLGLPSSVGVGNAETDRANSLWDPEQLHGGGSRGQGARLGTSSRPSVCSGSGERLASPHNHRDRP